MKSEVNTQATAKVDVLISSFNAKASVGGVSVVSSDSVSSNIDHEEPTSRKETAFLTISVLAFASVLAFGVKLSEVHPGMVGKFIYN